MGAYGHTLVMAVTHKVTYSLKPHVVERISELAVQWGVPKSEIVQRAVNQLADRTLDSSRKESPLEIFLRMQKRDGISRAVAAKFNREVRRARRAADRKIR